MITCPNCNKQLEDGTKFCDECGAKIEETIFCPNCGKQTSTEFEVCQDCGASLAENVVTSPEVEEEEMAPQSKWPFKFSKKVIALGGAGIAVIILVILVLNLAFSGSSRDFALYFKEGEVYYTSASKTKPWQVTSQFIEEEDVDDEDLAELGGVMGLLIRTSDDGKRLFYVDRIDKISSGVAIYYRPADKPKKDPVKIDSEISTYVVSETGDCVTYIKGEDKVLYRHNLKDKEKIDSEVSSFNVSDDGKSIVYLDQDDRLYLKRGSKDKEKLDSDVSNITYVNDDFNTVYYVKDDTLYKKVVGKDKVKVAKDISSVISVYESGEIYYLKANSKGIKLGDYVEDDMKDTDVGITKPEYPYSSNYSTTEEYKAAYAAYREASKAYDAKEDRDELRKDLAKETIDDSSYTLCYYNGKKEKVLTDTLFSKKYSSNYNAAENNPVIIFSDYEKSADTKLKLSEIDSIYDAEDLVEAVIVSASEKRVAVKDNITTIKQTAAENFHIDADGKVVYFVDNVSEKTNCGELYRMSISGNKPKKPELYDKDVYASGRYFTDAGQYVYYKDVEDGVGELYVEKKKIDKDVKLSSVVCPADSDSIIYMVNWDEKNEYGTLKCAKNGKAKKIADEVNTFEATPEGEVFYLYDYSSNYYKGELFLYKNGKSKKIDDDVIVIIEMYDFTHRGEEYNGR